MTIFRSDQPTTRYTALKFAVQPRQRRLKSVPSSSREGRLNLDMYMSRLANKNLEDAQDSLKRMLREAFRWLLVPMQDVQPGKGMSEVKWDRFQINPAATVLTADI